MKIEEQYLELEKIRGEVNALLQNPDRETIKKLALRFVKPGSMGRLFWKDNQLFMLHCFCTIWISEQKKLSPLELGQDIFEGVRSLSDVEDKYMSIKFGVLRLELPMPKEYCEEAVCYFLENHISGIALHYIIKNETWKREHNLISLAQLLKEKGEYATAVVLLQEAEETFPENRKIHMELADCWMAGQQWDRVYQCLEKIRKPGKAVRELKKEIEKVAVYEKVQ